MRKIVSLIVLVAALSPSAGIAENMEPQVPTVTAAFLVYCAKHEKACEDYFSRNAFSHAMLNALQGTPGFCGTGDAWKAGYANKDAYETYLRWARLHPETASKTTSESIDAALDELYPCQPPVVPSSAEFIAKCRTDPDDCLTTVIARTLRLSWDKDPKFCRPDGMSTDQSLADDKAIVQTMIANAASLPENSHDAVDNALRARYPCHK